MRGALLLLPLFLHSVMIKYARGSLPLRIDVRLFKAECIQGCSATVFQPHHGNDVSRYFTHAGMDYVSDHGVKVHVLVGKI